MMNNFFKPLAEIISRLEVFLIKKHTMYKKK